MNSLVNGKIELIIDKLVNLKLDEELIKKYSKLDPLEAKKEGFFARDFAIDQWDWPQGIGLFGLHISNADHSEYIMKWSRNQVKAGLPVKNINTTCPMLTLMDFSEYESLSLEWLEWIKRDLTRTLEGGLQHNTTGDDKYSLAIHDQQLWADTLFMTVLFETKMAIKYQDQEALNDAIYQVLLHTKYLLDRETGLFYHGWDFNEQSNYGEVLWCRGNSWLTMFLPIFIGMTKDHLSLSLKKYFISLYKTQVDTLVKLRGENHLWHTLLSDDTTYTETSGSAGIVAGILMGIENGILEIDEYWKSCEESILKLIEQIDAEGNVKGVSAGTNISSNTDDYKRIMIRPMPYGQAMMLLALNYYIKVEKKRNKN